MDLANISSKTAVTDSSKLHRSPGVCPKEEMVCVLVIVKTSNVGGVNRNKGFTDDWL
jgi:hypothetical protein